MRVGATKNFMMGSDGSDPSKFSIYISEKYMARNF